MPELKPYYAVPVAGRYDVIFRQANSRQETVCSQLSDVEATNVAYQLNLLWIDRNEANRTARRWMQRCEELCTALERLAEVANEYGNGPFDTEKANDLEKCLKEADELVLMCKQSKPR